MAQTTRLAKAAPAKAKIGSYRLSDMDYVKDPILVGSFVIWLGSENGAQQWTFHHPVGETALKGTQWVATPTAEIDFLLKRRSSEELSAWLRKAELRKRELVLAAGKGRKLTADQTEVWSCSDAPAIGQAIKDFQKSAKDKGKPEGEWLAFAPESVQKAETEFKSALKGQELDKAWTEVNPRPTHETCGGPLGDRKQEPIAYLGELSTGKAKDQVLRRVLGLEVTNPTGNGQMASAVPVPVPSDGKPGNPESK